jgi:hypothetical protein
MEKLNVESRLNELLEKKLRAGTLPFTFSRAELLEGSYGDPENYYLRFRLHDFNGVAKDSHISSINCTNGDLKQIMFRDNGFPGGSVVYDRVSIPEDILKTLPRVADYFESVWLLSDDIKKETSNINK